MEENEQIEEQVRAEELVAGAEEEGGRGSSMDSRGLEIFEEIAGNLKKQAEEEKNCKQEQEQDSCGETANQSLQR